MKEKKRYLIIWQMGSNDQSKDETAIDVWINNEQHAESAYKAIKEAFCKKIKVSINELNYINILGVYQL